MDMHQIINFLLYGGMERGMDTVSSYHDTLKKGCDPIYKRLDSLYPDETERDEAAADLSEALTAYEYVYMDLGIKAGARLIYQLLLTTEKVTGK